MQLFKWILFIGLIVLAGLPAAADELRIVSLSPALTEIVCHLGGEELLVGRTAACDYPKSVRQLPSVGRFGTPEIERIVSLRPTLVIGNDLMNHNVARKLQELGIEVRIRQINSMDDYRYWVDFIGQKTGRRKEAQAELARMDRQLAELAALPDSRISALWVVNAKPLMVAGPGSLPDMVMKLMKIKNVAGNANNEYFKCSNEWLLRSDPDWVIWAVPGSPNARRGIWSKVAAVRQDQVIKNISRSPVMRPGPRFLENVLKLRSALAR